MNMVPIKARIYISVIAPASNSCLRRDRPFLIHLCQCDIGEVLHDIFASIFVGRSVRLTYKVPSQD
jgi:hypothetical protein